MDDLGNVNDYDYKDYENMTLDPYMPVDNSSRTPGLSPPKIIALVIFAAVFLVGVPGNILVVWVTGSEARRTVNAIWFLNLAVADLLSCLALPIMFVTVLMDDHWVFGNVACHIIPSLILLNMYTSILLLAAISIDRFLLVFNPIWCQKYRQARWAWAACVLAWSLGLLLSIPSFLFRNMHVDRYPYKVSCGVKFGDGTELQQRAVATTRLLVGFLGPLVTLAICYTFLLIRAWSRSATRSPKTLKVVVAVVTSFFVCWLPYQVTGMIMAFEHANTDTFKSVSYLDALCVSITYISCCINPIIYVVAALGFRERFLRSLPASFRNLLTEESVVRESRSFTLSTVDSPAPKV